MRLLPPRVRPPKIARFDPPEGKRLIAVSDIHGALDYLRGVLHTVQFSPEDTLVIDGDLLERGPRSLDTLRYVMDLSRTHRVRFLSGNWDWWVPILFEYRHTDAVLYYLLHAPHGLLWQMLEEMGWPIGPDMDIRAATLAARDRYGAEFDFLAAAPEILETEHLTFVHGGLPQGGPSEWDAWQCMKCDAFLRNPPHFDKWTVVGHTPVVLYHENVVDANPIVDRDHRVIAIDGGCVLKDDGQLNALILPHEGSEDFSFAAWDPFPTATVLREQAGSERSWYIRWGDSAVEVLEQGEEFSRIRHRRTGYEMLVLSKYLRKNGTVNDCTDYVLPLRPGDEVRVVETTSRGYFVKHRGVSGWYFGPLRLHENEGQP
ncbi:MAG: metallophosphoesterase [Oscillospiraceae bacterium]|nr:metallophosphoesterase [Oscillospiraceae bacterium]